MADLQTRRPMVAPARIGSVIAVSGIVACCLALVLGLAHFAVIALIITLVGGSVALVTLS